MNKIISHFSFIGILVVLSLVLTYSIQIPKKDVSTNDAFYALYPKAKNVRWEVDKADFLIFFQDGMTQKYCRLAANGNCLENGVAVALPTQLQEAYKPSSVFRAYRIAFTDGGKGHAVILHYDGGFVLEVLDDTGMLLREKFLPAPLWIAI